MGVQKFVYQGLGKDEIEKRFAVESEAMIPNTPPPSRDVSDEEVVQIDKKRKRELVEMKASLKASLEEMDEEVFLAGVLFKKGKIVEVDEKLEKGWAVKKLQAFVKSGLLKPVNGKDVQPEPEKKPAKDKK